MSLIDEALKRAELEAARRDGLRGGTYPWVPEHMPRRRRHWVLTAMTLLGLGIVAGGLLWARRAAAPTRNPKSRIENPSSRVQGQELETVEVAPPPAALAGGRSARGKLQSPKPDAKVRNPTTASGGPVPARVPTSGLARSTSAAAERGTMRALADGKTYVGEVTAPDGAKIELGGIVYSDENPVALINGKVLGPGAVVEELTIVSIKPDRVELRGRGITMFLVLK